MHIKYVGSMALIAAAAVVACGSPESTSPTSPSAPPATFAAPPAPTPSAPASTQTVHAPTYFAAATSRLINMMDACDGPTFNAAIGPGTCARSNGVPFDQFVKELTAHHSAGAWHNAPPQTEAFLGDSLVAVNKGGEVHTFTRVAQFGGGVVPFLNDLSGTPDVVPECAAETTYVPPGGSDTEKLNQTGTLNYQCCIHPWMRTTVVVKSH